MLVPCRAPTPNSSIARLDIPVESIDRLEIIRGPMSVIYGNNAFQGVVNVVTNRIDRSGSRIRRADIPRESNRAAGGAAEGDSIG